MTEKLNEINCSVKDLEALKDDLEGAGDKEGAKIICNAIDLLDEFMSIHIPKHVEEESDCTRCPKCFELVYGRNGRCWKCGQRYVKC